MFQPTINLGDERYRVTPLNSDDARPIARTILAALPSIIANVGADTDLEGMQVLSAVGSVFEAIDDQSQEEIISTLLPSIELLDKQDGDEVPVRLDTIYKTHFRGRLATFYLVIAFALKVNCSDFLDASVGSGLQAVLETPVRRSPTISTG